jgi:hypothetical protein
MPAKTINVDYDFGGVAKITGLSAPSASTDAVRLQDLNSVVEGLSWKDSCRVSPNVNTTLASPGATLDGISMTANDRVLLRSQTTQHENGIYIYNGAATPMTRSADMSAADEFEQAITTIEEGSNAGASFRQQAVNITIGSTSVTFTAFGVVAPAASETTAGIAEIATQAETDTGSDDARFITPLKLANHSNRKRKVSQTFGDATATVINISHNFNTRDVITEVFRASGNYDNIDCLVGRNTVNIVRLEFNVAPASNSLSCVVIA